MKVQTRSVSAASIGGAQRAIAMAPQTANPAGTVEAVLCTEEPVEIFDRVNRRIVDEILLASAVRFREHVPVLDTHGLDHSSVNVHGSLLTQRRDGTRWIGTLQFDIEDAETRRIWGKVERGFLRDVSLGYLVLKKVDIAPRTTQTVQGRTFTATDRPLRVVLEADVFEVSVTPIGADRRAKFRNILGDHAMNRRLMAFLRRLGLAADATDDTARQFRSALTGLDAVIADILDYDEADTDRDRQVNERLRALGRDHDAPWIVLRSDPGSQAAAGDGDDGDDDASANAAEGDSTGDAGANDTAGSADGATGSRSANQDLERRGVLRERTRQDRIRDLATLAGPAITEHMVGRAISEGWGINRTQSNFAQAARDRVNVSQADTQSQPTRRYGWQQSPSTVSRDAASNRVVELVQRSMGRAANASSHEDTQHVLALSCALARRSGIREPQDMVIANHGPSGFDTFNSDTVPQVITRAFEHSDRLASMSMVDVARECLRINGEYRHWAGTEEVIEQLRNSPTSNATLTAVFQNTFSSELLASYMGFGDTTRMWTSEGDLPNFMTADRARLEKGSRLTKHTRAGSAEHMTRNDALEQYRIERYSGQFVIDEMDIINDRFGGSVAQSSPGEMGEAAAELRPDLVYSLLRANAAMRDSVALFHTTHGNTASATFSATTLRAAITALLIQTENGRNLSNPDKWCIIEPTALWFTVEQLVGSSRFSLDSGAGERNPLYGIGISHVAEPRLDNGVTDPNTGTSYSGSATTWYLAALNRRHTVEVGYLRGSNRMPRVRTFNRSQGVWGIGFDVLLDIGTKALDWKGLYYAS